MSAFDRELLDALVAEGWLRTQRHPDADLWIYNYTEKTQYENHWTPETLACRGLILDADGEIVARPFSKFFNYGTPQAVIPAGERFTVTEKFDGSLGILYWLGGLPCIATRGSFTSEQAGEGTLMIRERTILAQPGTTPLFEILYPSNRIVVDYGDRRDLVLLACIDNATGSDAPLPRYDGPATTTIDVDDIAWLSDLEGPNAEGFVVAFESGQRVKVKFDEYVRLHRIVTGINARAIWDVLRHNGSFEDLLTNVPDEIYTWITDTRDSLWAHYAAIERACLRVFERRPADAHRKVLAHHFQASGANTAVLFRMLDGKPYDDLIWKAVKPGPLTPDRAFTEDVA